MIKNLCFLLLFLATLFSYSSSASDNSENFRYRISILSYSPGEEVYSSFGHSAIRVIDRKYKTDQVYNYGTFDFDAPGFYTNFIKGQLLYKLSKRRMGRVMRSVRRENRSLYENELLLTHDELNRMVDLLENNYLPENRSYLYDFYYDNCASRIVSIIDSTSNKRFVKSLPNYNPKSFSQLTSAYLQGHKWTDLGIKIILGIESHKKASELETAFLPDYLQLILINSRDRVSNNPLVGKTRTLIKASYSIYPQGANPAYILAILFVLSAFVRFREYKNKKQLKYMDYLILSLPIFLAYTILILWLISDHYVYAWNPSLLWANPLWILVFKSKFRKLKAFQFYSITMLVLAIAYSIIWAQSVALLIIILIVGTRLIYGKQD